MTQLGPGRSGQGKSIKQILKDIGEPDEKLLNDVRYKEGYSDGYAAATENHRQLTAALAATYRIDRFGQ
jgi:hypothetical protein